MKWRHYLGFWALILVIFCPLGHAETAEAPVISASQSEATTTEHSPKPSSVVNSAYNPSRVPSQSVSGSANLLSLMLGLILIVLLILALGWLARRMGQGGLLGNKHIKLLSAMPLGTRERLVLVDVAGQQLLLGVTATQITHLHAFAEPVIDPDAPVAPSDFSRKLLSFMQQKSSAHSRLVPDAEIK